MCDVSLWNMFVFQSKQPFHQDCTNTIRQKKEIKCIQIGVKIKLSLSTGNMSIYGENPKEVLKNLLELKRWYIYKLNKICIGSISGKQKITLIEEKEK